MSKSPIFEVYEPGTTCVILQPNGPGMPADILSAAVGLGWRVNYEVCWWAAGSRITAWLDSSEIAQTGDSVRKIGIGFGAAR
ncbi:MAG: hypothetical protein PHU85_00120 [Phycisphaerae bacterium]|nr:hypothetical protein [Phycisphaerae bacterium]